MLAGATQARDAFSAGDPNWNAKAVAAATGAFDANHQKSVGVTSTATATATQNATNITMTVAASATVPTTFMRVGGVNSVTVANQATATTSPYKYTDIHLVVDDSPSMGIGATKADQDLIYNKTGCQIACHYRWGNPGDSLAAARSTGAVLRLDVVKNALAQALKGIPNDGRTRVAIYTLSNSLTTVFPLSSDLNGAQSALQALEIGGASAQGGSNVGYSLTALNQLLGTAGNGYTQASPTGIVVLATDGVEDNLILYSSGSGFNWGLDPNFKLNPVTLYDASGLNFQTLDPSKCAPIKSEGYNFFTLEVAYIIPSPVAAGYDMRLNFIKNTLLPTEIPKAMSQCASSASNYYHAESSADISNAVTKMFSTFRPLRLTN